MQQIPKAVRPLLAVFVALGVGMLRAVCAHVANLPIQTVLPNGSRVNPILTGTKRV